MTSDLHATFPNQPPVDFAQAENRQAMTEALATVRSQFGRRYPLVINGEPIETDTRGARRDPSQLDRIVGEVCHADERHAVAAVAAAHVALPAWWRLGAASRAEIVRRAANEMRPGQLLPGSHLLSSRQPPHQSTTTTRQLKRSRGAWRF